ncbi:MAG: hypothetical protein ACKPKO_42365, partial [Candidatus Fonsibacter sp.]
DVTPQRFSDRNDAGQCLAELLAQHRPHDGTVVLALPRGGLRQPLNGVQSPPGGPGIKQVTPSHRSGKSRTLRRRAVAPHGSDARLCMFDVPVNVLCFNLSAF